MRDTINKTLAILDIVITTAGLIAVAGAAVTLAGVLAGIIS